MFEGDRHCAVCKNEIPEKNAKFGVSLTGFTHVFCTGCYENKKEQVKKILHHN